MNTNRNFIHAIQLLGFTCVQMSNAMTETTKQLNELKQKTYKTNENNHPFKRFIGNGYRK